MQDRAFVNAFCATQPGAEVSQPFGPEHDCWKVGGKMFACIGARLPGVSVKCPDTETAALLIETGIARRAPYFHASWVNLPDTTGDEELAHRLDTAYRIIRDALPRKIRAGLPDLAPR